MSVFEVPQPLLVTLVLRVKAEKFQRLFDLHNVRTAEREFQTDIVFQTFVREVCRVLRDEIHRCIHGAACTYQLVCQRLALRHVQERPCFIQIHDLEHAPVRMDEIQRKGADNNEHGDRQKLHRRKFLKRSTLVRQHQIGHLYDIELLFKADGLFDVPIRKQQVRKVVVREALNMVCDTHRKR